VEAVGREPTADLLDEEYPCDCWKILYPTPFIQCLKLASGDVVAVRPCF